MAAAGEFEGKNQVTNGIDLLPCASGWSDMTPGVSRGGPDRRKVVEMNPGDAGRGPGMARRQGTVLESVEEIRAQIRGAGAFKEPSAAPAAGTATATGPLTGMGGDQDTAAFRPTLRPPMAVLHVLDDGDDAGEIVRIRPNSFVIGRVEGDLTIPHDGGISGRHVEISRRHENGEYCWYLKDLQSTNGTFVRASTVVLNHEQELLIGGRRFRFEVPAVPEQSQAAPEWAGNATRKWESLAAVSGRGRVAAGDRRDFAGTLRAAVPAARAGKLAGSRSESVLDCG